MKHITQRHINEAMRQGRIERSKAFKVGFQFIGNAVAKGVSSIAALSMAALPLQNSQTQIKGTNQ